MSAVNIAFSCLKRLLGPYLWSYLPVLFVIIFFENIIAYSLNVLSIKPITWFLTFISSIIDWKLYGENNGK